MQRLVSTLNIWRWNKTQNLHSCMVPNVECCMVVGIIMFAFISGFSYCLWFFVALNTFIQYRSFKSTSLLFKCFLINYIYVLNLSM